MANVLVKEEIDLKDIEMNESEEIIRIINLISAESTIQIFLTYFFPRLLPLTCESVFVMLIVYVDWYIFDAKH